MSKLEDKIEKRYRLPGEQIPLDELKSFLWGAATRLRGQIDAAGYKEYIFPLLFFKRISDVYDEQFQGFAAEGGDEYAEMQAAELAIRIPEGAHWRDVREVTENVGQRLVEAFIAIEQANPGEEADGRVIGGLEGIFGPKDGWTNKAKMPDHIITSLIEDFSRYDLGLSSCPADEMGQAYEYLVGKFADDAGNTAQEFYTNRTVVTLMAEILQPQPDESIYDPTCGSGGMLVKCLDFLRQKGLPWQGVKVFGQEINALTSAIARMNLYLNGVEDFSIVREDTLAHPAFVDGSHLRKFDIVLANPASMATKTGRCSILLPHGILFRKEERDMREKLVKMDTLEAVIALGHNLFYNSAMISCILVCRVNKPVERKGKVIFIDAENEVTRKNAFSYLDESQIQKILNAYNGFVDIDGFAKVVTNEEIIQANSVLSISYYVEGIDDEDFDIDDSLQNWKESSNAFNNEFESLFDLITGKEYV